MRARLALCSSQMGGLACELPARHGGGCRFGRDPKAADRAPDPDRPGIRWETVLRCDQCPDGGQCWECTTEQMEIDDA